MVFSSIAFLCIFLPVVIIGNWALPEKYRNVFLLLMSLIFYACGGIKAFIILAFSIILNYACGILLHRSRNKKVWLVIGICANLAILFIFKYLNLVALTIGSLFPRFAFEWTEIKLPAGISFFTFQGLSYVIDVYRQEQAGVRDYYQKSIKDLALYISMFPQLIAGPIVRYDSIRDNLYHRKRNYDSFAKGLIRFTAGLAKKVLIADYLGDAANQIMNVSFGMIGASSAWLGALCYTLQIFYDFSGYSDMAIGMGWILGFEFPENFDFPYISRSVKEFWRRWHMSLSSWFRDYLYIPMGGSRRGNVYVNLAIVFLITGIWHGADWSFLAWGAWHGFFIICERVFHNKCGNVELPGLRKTLTGLISWVYTMLVVMIGWVLFALADFGKTFEYVRVMLGNIKYDYIAYNIEYFLNKRLILVMVIAILFSFPIKKFISKYIKAVEYPVTQYIGTIVILVLSFIKIVYNGYSPFIYFRF